jgi:hypothetical protein
LKVLIDVRDPITTQYLSGEVLEEEGRHLEEGLNSEIASWERHLLIQGVNDEQDLEREEVRRHQEGLLEVDLKRCTNI